MNAVIFDLYLKNEYKIKSQWEKKARADIPRRQ